MGIDDRGHRGISGTELRCRVPAVATQLPALRRALGAWARAHLSAEQAEDLTLASYEAMANVVEHAYPAQVGMLDVHATCTTDHEVTVTVTDYGGWRTPDQLPDSRSGRGLPLIRALAGVAVITATADL